MGVGTAVRVPGGRLKLRGVAHSGEFVVGPAERVRARHSDPTRMRDLIARRSSIAR
jgi:hypothetical protein